MPTRKQPWILPLAITLAMVTAGCSDSDSKTDVGNGPLLDDPNANANPEQDQPSAPVVDTNPGLPADSEQNADPGSDPDANNPVEPGDPPTPEEPQEPENPESNLGQQNPSIDPPSLAELGVPNIDSNANIEVRRVAALLDSVVAEGLTDLNQKLQSGEQFSAAESLCLGSFDPAVGEALIALNCGENRLALENGVYPLYVTQATFAATEACNNGLLALDGSSCRLVSADITVPVEWSTPSNGLPQPFASGSIEFNLTPDNLAIESLPNSVTINFSCSFDFATNSTASIVGGGNCERQLNQLNERLQTWLDRRSD